MIKQILVFSFLVVGYCNSVNAQKVVTFAGSGLDSLVDGKGIEASFGKCFGIGSDKKGNIYVPDTEHHCIRKIDRKGNVTTIAGTGTAGNKNGEALNATFTDPAGVCVDREGNLIVTDWGGNKIRRIDTKGIVTTVAGLDSAGYVNGRGDSAMFCAPRGSCVDDAGNIYVGDCWNHCIRKITPDGNVTTLAGGGQPYVYFNRGSWKDGNASEARFDAPCGVHVDPSGNVYTADANTNLIRKITPEGTVTTIAGSFNEEGKSGGLRDGQIDTAMLWVPTELVMDDEGYLFIGDSYNNCVRMLTPEGRLYTIAGNGEKGYQDGENSICDSPRGITLVKKDVYFFDHYNNRLRRIINPKKYLKKKKRL